MRVAMAYIYGVSFIGNVLWNVRRMFHRPAHQHGWSMVPVTNGLRLPNHPQFEGLVEHRAECLTCGQRPKYGSAEYEECERNHDRRVTAMLEARGE